MGNNIHTTNYSALYCIYNSSYKADQKKKPVWAYNVIKLIGLGANAPPELTLTFDDKPVNEVYQTTFVFFNSGTNTIRRCDATENIAIHFKGAEVLREPTMKARSKEAIEFSAKQVVGEWLEEEIEEKIET